MKFKQLTHMKFQHPAYPYMFHLFLQEPNEIFTFNFPFDKWENIGLENYNDLFKFIELRVLKQGLDNYNDLLKIIELRVLEQGFESKLSHFSSPLPIL